MKFLEIYKSNLQAVKSGLTSLWCSEAKSDKQRGYAVQLKNLIDNELFVSENNDPLVQSMERYESASDQDVNEIFQKIDKELWQRCTNGKNYPPYKHQVAAWRSLTADDCRSMVVTTGTGSGKTECFMVPLINDLKRNRKLEQNIDPDEFHTIKAIFLYPLNALMEDQKERLLKLLKGTGLTFAVYNSNLPESGDGNEEKAEEIEVTSRTKLHKNGADILLTNPTMLEYMLIRSKDQVLFTENSLRWLVVDEAHTFTGAAAAELSMLFRRLLLAFGTKREELHFAASSATIGNDSDKKEQEEALQKFISDISGIDCSKIDVIDGKRIKYGSTADDEFSNCKRTLSTCDYIKLSELFPHLTTTEARLAKLDELCDESRSEQERLRAKVHFFYRVANMGIRVRLDDWADRSKGLLRLHSNTPTHSEDETPYLELVRCEHCGEYLAIGETGQSDATIGCYWAAPDTDDDDLFDMSADSSSKVFFGIVRKEVSPGEGNICITVDKNKYRSGDIPEDDWYIVANTNKQCPHCSAKLLPTRDDNDSHEDETADDETKFKVSRLRISGEFISRLLAPSLLNQMRPTKRKDENGNIQIDSSKPHLGQQYISFVDSRQAAAKGTFNQNIDVEREWVFSRIYNKLVNLSLQKEANKQKLKELEDEIRNRIQVHSLESLEPLIAQCSELQKKIKDYLTWKDIYDLLAEDPCCDQLCRQFVNQTSEDELEGETINDECREKYIHAIMISNLAKYPLYQACAENMGLFAPYYPKLDKITEVPNDLKELLGGIDISVEEWRNLLQIYIDRVSRSNESLYLRMENDSRVDIFNCTQRFGLKHMPHRTALKPFLKKDEHCKNPSKIFYLLAKVIAPDSDNLVEVIKKNREKFNTIANLMWKSLTEECQLLQYSEYLKNGQWKKDKDKKKDTESIPSEQLNHNGYQLRLNVADIAFRLPEKIYYSEIKRGKKIYIRPTYTIFCGYSPYKINGNLNNPLAEESWDTYYDSKQSDIKNIENWLKEHRPKMYEYGLLGDDGCFNNRVLSVLSCPTPFIQAEHTAQVDKKLSRRFQEMFKQQELNILACSTTMEMGVDLGNLELVLMSSIPPHPANYKQRAGRSGRNDSSRSACITLCSSDAVGSRILRDPMKNIINRQVAMPRVDMDCETIIQRHVNALLYRLWLTTSRKGQTVDNAKKDNPSNALNWRIIDIFSYNYRFGKREDNQGREVKDIWKLLDSNDNYVYPTDKNPLGDKTGSRYEGFAIWLKDNVDETIVNQILDNTPFFNQGRRFIERCSEEWEKRYNDIERELSYYGKLYKKACEESPRMVENGNFLNTKFGKRLIAKFNSIFDRRLIEYLATHRFTPNANMPVNVVELDVAHSRKRAYRDPSLPSNPSYSLRQALSQYAPGNMIIKENRVIRVAGVEYYGQDAQQDKQIFHFDGTHVVGAESGPDKLIPEDRREIWRVNGKTDLELIRVKAFLPDINENDSRRLSPAPYTKVNAYLVGTEDWKPSGRHLMNARANRDAGDAKILYYNDGIDYGYCLCPKCGKMELEHGPGGRVWNLPEAMTEIEGGHYAIDRFDDNGNKKHCQPPVNGYNRNVIIGDLIQTDFCEMSLRHYSESRPLDSQSDKSLLTTLGLAICRAYTEYIGKERDSVDFIVMMNGHLCIFDTNPGGSGYANKLANSDTRQEVLRLALDMLESIIEKEELLDKFTVQHLNHIDIEKTKKWIEAELATWTLIPEEIQNKFPEGEVIYSNVWYLIEQFKLAAVNGQSGVLFCDDQFEKWDYNNAWLPRIPEIARAFVTISGGVELVIPHNDVIPTEALSMLPYNGWMKISTTRQDMLSEGIHPLAYVNGRLYFTDGRWSMNGDWGRDDVFYIERTEFNVEKKAVDFSSSSDTSIFYLDDEENKKSFSTGLADIVLDLAKKSGLRGLDDFIDYCSNNREQPIKIQYVDEHLKSVAGMITILHFIENLLKRMGRKDNFHVRFETEEYYEASSYVVADAWRNIERYERRNEILKRIVDIWLKETYHKENAEALNMWENVCKPHNSIPHWRVLNIECGRKRLSIFPHGGIINEWRIDFSVDKEHRYTAEDNTSSKLPLFREKPIMYIVKCEQL